MRRGMPPPPRVRGLPITNIRHTSSPHWRGWPNLETTNVAAWFELNEDCPLFAGIWTAFIGDGGRKPKPVRLPDGAGRVPVFPGGEKVEASSPALPSGLPRVAAVPPDRWRGAVDAAGFRASRFPTYVFGVDARASTLAQNA